MPPEQRRRVTEAVIAALVELLRRLGSWREADANRFTTQAVPLVAAGQRALADAVAQAIAAQAQAATGGPVAPVAIPSGTVTALRGTNPRAVYRRPFVDIWTALARGERLDTAVDLGATRLAEIAEGDMQLAFAHANQQAMQRLPERIRPRYWRRTLQGEYSCGLCVIAATNRYRVEELNPIHPNCIPEGSRVRADGVLAVARRRYAGELAILATAHGNDVSVTPNHPVLTHRGWVAARDVGEGDHLVNSARLDRESRNGPHERQRPPLIEDVWYAASVTGFVRMPMAPEDFHGDGADGEIEVVRTDSDFPAILHTASGQQVRDNPLVAGQRPRTALASGGDAAPLRPAGSTAPGSAMRVGDLGGPLGGGHLCGAHAARVRTATDDNPVLAQHATYGAAADVTFGRKAALRFSAEVGRNQVFDRVTAVRRVPFAGHVYDLQTSRQVYESGDHIVHNCDCGVEPDFSNTRFRADDEALLKRAHEAARELTGRSDAGGRAVDYRHLIVQHGELGPMLARPQDHFTGPGSLPSTN